MEKDLAQLVEKLSLAAGPNLNSVVLYGSAASGEYHPKHSDLNVLAVLERLSAGELDLLNPVGTWWAGKGNPAPLLFAREELHRSADIFAIEFIDICAHRRILQGEDLFEGFLVPMWLHREQVERELRTKLLGLRQSYLLASPRGDARVKLMTASVSTFATLFRHALLALGEGDPAKPALGKREAISNLATLFGFDAGAFDEILDVREGKRSAKDLDVAATFSRYLSAIERAMDQVDKRFASGAPPDENQSVRRAGK
jgi:predicted nucleotidyltransferase